PAQAAVGDGLVARSALKQEVAPFAAREVEHEPRFTDPWRPRDVDRLLCVPGGLEADPLRLAADQDGRAKQVGGQRQPTRDRWRQQQRITASDRRREVSRLVERADIKLL